MQEPTAIISPAPVKVGRGIEFTLEALLEILAERFPNVIEWDELSNRMPSLDFDFQNQRLGLYWCWFTDTEVIDHSVHPIRRMSEGAPIPSAYISLDNVTTRYGMARCGSMISRSRDGQCKLELHHSSEHVFD